MVENAAAAATFVRFFPKIKARYDYGFLIFILTFSFISISGLQATEIIELAHKRLTTIVIGASTSLIINIFLCPVWAGEELHNSISLNMEKLANFLEGFGGVYFKISEAEAKSKDGNKQLLQGYKSVLNSKSPEENLVCIPFLAPYYRKKQMGKFTTYDLILVRSVF